MTETRTAPARYIEADTYAGRWTRRSNTVRSDVFTARELATTYGTGKEFVAWTFYGHVGGPALYARDRFIGQEDGSLAGYAADGHLVIIHPADREIRIATR